MADISVAIVSIDGAVWSGDAASITCTTVDGEIGILPGRQPILAQMSEEGVVTVRSTDGEYLVYAVSGGLMSCTGSRVTIMAERAFSAADLSVDVVEKEVAALPEDAEFVTRATAHAKLKAVKRLAAA